MDKTDPEVLSILDNIKEQLPFLTASQRDAADYILKNPMTSAFCTISELASEAGVSTNTIVRLADRLGFSGYSHFQSHLREYVKKSNQTPAGPQIVDDFSQSDGFKKTIFDVTALVLDNIKQTYGNIDPAQLDKAAKAIHNSEHIYLCGTGNCISVVNTLFIKLTKMLSIPVSMVSKTADVAAVVSNIGEKDTVIVSSLTRYSKFTINFLKLTRKNGAFTIVITDSPKAPGVRFGDVAFIAENKKNDFHNSIVSSCYIVDLIIYKCVEFDPELADKKFEQIESIHSSMSYYEVEKPAR